MNREEIEVGIKQISDLLKKPGIPNVERLLLNEDRRDLRNLLAEMDGKPRQPSPFDDARKRKVGK